MTEVYSRRLRAVADEAARAMGLRVEHGTYLGVTGPSFETPAEIRAFRTLGADAVGMSTVLEAIAARHAGIELLGLSCISNLASGLGPAALSERDVLGAVGLVHAEFAALLEGILARL
jgi:purine-nucleoside phosphorylase